MLLTLSVKEILHLFVAQRFNRIEFGRFSRRINSEEQANPYGEAEGQNNREYRDYRIKAAEVGNIFTLKYKYSEPLGLEYTDQEGERKTVFMGCYGIGVSRVMGVIAEKFADDKGLVWPKEVAPYQLYLVPIGDKAGEIAAKTEQYKKEIMTPKIAAERGYITEVINPEDTRSRIVSSFDFLETKIFTNKPLKKHGNIPL